jgi:hypothetical protein
MSELIQKNDNRATIRWKLLTGVSALALIASSPAMAGDDHPLIWIELGADADAINGTGSSFTAPFLEQTPTPGPFTNGSPVELQKPPRFTFGGEGSITFQPEDSNWVFSAGIRYGRSSNRRDVHHQTQVSKTFYNPLYQLQKLEASKYPSYFHTPTAPKTATKYAQQFAQTTVKHSEQHLVLDFQAGKDFGLGMFGHDGTSVLSAGVRVARFDANSEVSIRAKPSVEFYDVTFAIFHIPATKWSTYYLHGQAERSFNGIGPSLSWSASAPLAGNVQDGQLSLDWGVNGAILFGRQKAKVSHQTTRKDLYAKYKTHVPTSVYPNRGYVSTHYFVHYKNQPPSQNRSRNVTVPNLGANIGISYRIEDAKLSLGYRADYFFGAMDTGIDKAKKTTLGFNGLYASISVGIGD